MIVHYPRHPGSNLEVAMGPPWFRDPRFRLDARVGEERGLKCRVLATPPIQ
jgi:hypothetical protein